MVPLAVTVRAPAVSVIPPLGLLSSLKISVPVVLAAPTVT
jgi:hypothetical protein